MGLRFGLIGAAGYIAPRHMHAIKEIGGDLIACVDPNDSVGIIDDYFPESQFFTEFERFDRFVDKLRRKGSGLDFLSVCSPNFLHDAHCRFGLRNLSDVICEKPLVLNDWNIDALQNIERETGKKIYNILQLRLHESIIALKNKIKAGPSDAVYHVDLAYLNSRGSWYHNSWKGSISKSGGITTNIGIHFFDMLIWIFGGVKRSVVHIHERDRAAGYLELEQAKVRWVMSVDQKLIPKKLQEQGLRTYRSIIIDGEEIEFSEGFTELHSRSYAHILNGEGFGTNDVKSSIQLVQKIRNSKPVGAKGEYHPLITR